MRFAASLSRKQGGIYHLHSLPQLRFNRRWPRGDCNGAAAVVSCNKRPELTCEQGKGGCVLYLSMIWGAACAGVPSSPKCCTSVWHDTIAKGWSRASLTDLGVRQRPSWVEASTGLVQPERSGHLLKCFPGKWKTNVLLCCLPSCLKDCYRSMTASNV